MPQFPPHATFVLSFAAFGAACKVKKHDTKERESERESEVVLIVCCVASVVTPSGL